MFPLIYLEESPDLIKVVGLQKVFCLWVETDYTVADAAVQ
jgi:hypothetical protein